MKKNLLSVLILALLVVNIALTAIMMVNVTSTNAKTAELVTSIATVMNLELYEPGGGVSVTDVSLDVTESYDMEEMMFPLAASTVVNADGSTSLSTKQNYIMFSMSLLQNTEDKDYKKLGGADNIAAKESVIKDTVNSIVGSHTLEECQTDFESIREEILQGIQQLFGSGFIYKIAISGVKYG
jgi:flagellar FliL protein